MSPISLPNVVVILARCATHGACYGLRFEETLPDQWVTDWAFPIKESSARREGYDRGEIRGRFVVADAFPGCPHCRAPGFFKCGCGRVACWDTESQTVTCPWCHRRLTFQGHGGGITSLKVREDI